MKLHYIFDPFCGWCYAASPLIQAVKAVLPIELHAGGMLTGDRRTRISPAFRQYVMKHDATIAQLTGQPFGEAYSNGLLVDTGVVLDSAPPITAILAAESLDGRGLLLLHRLQDGHYVEGLRISEPEMLIGLAGTIGLDRNAFEAEFERQSGDRTDTHIAASRQMLSRVGGQGFPTLVLEHNARLERIEHARWYADAPGFARWLNERFPEPREESAKESSPFCSPAGCT